MRFTTITIATAVAAILLAGFSDAATPCDPVKCIPPACLCPSVSPPGGLLPKDVPQFFTLTFDDAVQAATVPVASAIMSAHRNPNNCPIKATWFAQTLYSDYALIQQWYAAGNEIADHTMNHIGTPPLDEIVGNRASINSFSGIPFAKLTGFRAPFLNYSKNTFDLLKGQEFQYDSSTTATTTDAYWPYTLDYGVKNDCWNGICDQDVTAPGMWEIPMHAIMDGDQGALSIPHNMDPQLDNPDLKVVDTWLRNNFARHYSGTRQPFGIYLHPVHVGNATQLYNDFFAFAAAQPDVWFVTNQQLLEWMKNPVPASQLASQPYMSCSQPAVGKEICNGLDDLKTGKIDAGVLETCNFAAGPWSTCYGCPSVMPTPGNPVPARVTAAGTAGARTPVPTTCAMEWWDPVAAQCLCTSSNCTFTDNAVSPTKTGNGSPSGTGSSKSAAAGRFDSSVYASLAMVAALAAGMAQLL